MELLINYHEVFTEYFRDPKIISKILLLSKEINEKYKNIGRQVLSQYLFNFRGLKFIHADFKRDDHVYLLDSDYFTVLYRFMHLNSVISVMVGKQYDNKQVCAIEHHGDWIEEDLREYELEFYTAGDKCPDLREFIRQIKKSPTRASFREKNLLKIYHKIHAYPRKRLCQCVYEEDNRCRHFYEHGVFLHLK